MEKLNWKPNGGSYNNGYNGYLGKYIVLTISWDGISRVNCISRGNYNRWKLYANLPGIKTYLGNHETVEAAKEKAEKVLEIWLNGASLKCKKGE